MSQLSLVQRVRFARDDIGRLLRYAIRPWADLHAVKIAQVDIINAVSVQQTEIAESLASIRKLGQELAQMGARVSELDARIRRIADK